MEKKTLETTTSNKGVQKTTRKYSKVTRFQETTVTFRTKTFAYVRDPSTMAVKMETIEEEPEEDDEAMEGVETVLETQKTGGNKNVDGIEIEDDDEPDFEKMWNEAN